MSDATGALAGLSAEQKRAMLARILGDRAKKPRRFPASHAQRTLWFLEQLAPGRPTYNMHASVRIEGTLNQDVFARALNEIVRRHESLRTTFEMVEGEPVLVIAPSLTLAIPELDLRGLPEDQRGSQARKLAAEEARRGFDLALGPLFRVKLLRLSEQEFLALLTLHHINADGWSVQLFLREMLALYEAFASGRPSPLPDLPIQYADYAEWQRKRIEQGGALASVHYWKMRLKGIAPLELPTDRPRPAVLSVRGAIRPFHYPAELGDALRALGRREQCTSFMTLLAALQVLLHRYSRQDDIAVGSPYANRPRPEVEGLIGYFVNMLVLRTDLGGDPTFLELLSRVRRGVLEAITHQELPFNKVVEELQVPRDLSRHPLFQVMFAYNNTPRAGINLDSLTMRLSRQPVEGGTGASKFELAVAMADSRKELGGRFQYNTDLFDAATIDRMIGHFRVLLEGIVANPRARLSELPLLTGAETKALHLAAGSRIAADAESFLSVHERFESHAARTPAAEAAVDGQTRLSHSELNRGANRLAHHLRGLGVGLETIVAIAATRPIDRMIAVLGVLKAGGAYLPIDLSTPRTRMASILEQAGWPILITDCTIGALPDEPYLGRVVHLETDRDAIARNLDSNPTVRVDPRNLAYLISTSGSLGQPKGVMVTHASLAVAFAAWDEAYALSDRPTRHFQMASFGFDVFTGDWVRALGSGGTLVFCPREILLEPEALHDLMERERVDMAEFVPAVIETLIPYLEESGRSLDFMRLLAVGSDVWRAEDYERLRRLAGPSARVVSSYGLTEATIDSTYFEGTLADRPPQVTVPIGRPLAGTHVYVLDRHRKLVPVGVPGELHIGGAGLARGYHNRPGLTAETFLPDPFSDEPGARMYRTGDLARWLPDGNLELLGRIDHQVKVRGHRIELTEVEAALLRHPDVREAVAVLASDRTLAAYLVPRAGRTIVPEALRHSLQSLLPRPMIPSTLLVLDAIPLNASGKIDRNALPPIAPSVTPHDRASVAPRDEVERALVAIWEELLKVKPIGVTDDFFDLGGHSLMAVRLIARIERRFGQKLPLSVLFLGATIENLAASLREAAVSVSDPGWGSPLVTIHAAGRARPLFLVHPVGGNVVCYHELVRHLDPERPVYGFQALGVDDDEAPETRLAELAARYVQALRRVDPEGPYHLAGWSVGGVIAFEMARQLRTLGAELGMLALIDSRVPSGLGRAAERTEADLHAAFLLDLARVHGVAEGARLEGGSESMRRLEAVFRATTLAVSGYAPAPQDVRLIYIRAAHSRSFRDGDATRGWSALARKGVEAHEVSGDHYALLRFPSVSTVGTILETAMAPPVQPAVPEPTPSGSGSRQ